MDKVRISWADFHKDCNITATKARQQSGKFDTIIAIARGGLVPARIIAETIKPQNFYSIGAKLYEGEKRGETICIYQDVPNCVHVNWVGNILVVDDISDGGSTLAMVVSKLKGKAPKAKIVTATPYIKTGTKFVPDFYHKEFPSNEWIVFPFEAD